MCSNSLLDTQRRPISVRCVQSERQRRGFRRAKSSPCNSHMAFAVQGLCSQCMQVGEGPAEQAQPEPIQLPLTAQDPQCGLWRLADGNEGQQRRTRRHDLAIKLSLTAQALPCDFCAVQMGRGPCRGWHNVPIS